jgi:hypothetical protein
MSVEVIKVTETYPKSSRVAVEKRKVVRAPDTYKEALDIVYDLNLRNTNPNITYITGSVIQR